MASPLLLGCCLLLLLSCCCCSGQQRYADRNVLPAASSPDDDDDPVSSYDYYGEEEEGDGSSTPLYGFGEYEEEGEDVYKWNVDEYPHPVNQPRFCNRMRASRVCDPDLVLQREQADLLDESIEALYRSTPCVCEGCDPNSGGGGILVGIALLKHLRLPYHVHHAKVIRSFAETLRLRWKLGRCDNDILIVVDTNDRLSYTDVGRTTSSRLMGVQEAHRIFLENKAKFSANNFSQGLTDILAAYRTRLLNTAAAETVATTPSDVGSTVGAIVGSGALLLGLLLFLIVYSRRRRNNGNIDPEAKDPDESISLNEKENMSSPSNKKERSGDPMFASAEQQQEEEEEEKKTTSTRRNFYQKMTTVEIDAGGATVEEEGDQLLDFTLVAAPPDDDDTSFPDRQLLTAEVTSDSKTLERDLDTAAHGIVRTFLHTNNNNNNVRATDM